MSATQGPPNNHDLRVWWIPQIPGKEFHVYVESVKEAKKVLNILARYDAFQFENKIKGDYCNTGGLTEFSEEENDWVDWMDDNGDTVDS